MGFDIVQRDVLKTDVTVLIHQHQVAIALLSSNNMGSAGAVLLNKDVLRGRLRSEIHTSRQ